MGIGGDLDDCMEMLDGMEVGHGMEMWDGMEMLDGMEIEFQIPDFISFIRAGNPFF